MTNTQQPTLMKFDNLSLKEIPLKTPFETTGFIKVVKKLPHEVELTIEATNQGKGIVKSFIKSSHPYFVWLRDEAPQRFHARLALTLTSPFNEGYKTSIGTLDYFTLEPYVEPTVVDTQALYLQLKEHLATIKNPALRALCKKFLNNIEMLQRFFYVPSSINTAYSFKNGLVAHTVVMMDRIESEVSNMTPRYYVSYTPNPLDKDLLKTAALFHDAGKMFAYELFEGEVTKTEHGEFLGKTLLSLEFLQEVYYSLIAEHPEYTLSSKELLNLKHIIASANGKLEHGAFVTPKTKEAEYFAYLENIDSTIGNYHNLERKQSKPGFTRLFNRQVYIEPYSGDGLELFSETEESVESSIDEANPSSETETSDSVETTTVETPSNAEEPASMDSVETLSETPTASEETPEAPSTDSLLAAIEAVAPEFTQVLEPSPSVQPISETQFVETPFMGQEVLAQTTDAVHPDFMTPVMNIPAEWPQTPSTAPVLANGMPVQPILPIQQPIDLMTDTTVFPATQNFPALGDNPFELTNENVLPFSNITPFVPQSETTVDEASSLNTDSASTDETIEEPSKKVASKKTTTKATKSTKSKSDEESKPTTKRTTKSTKSTKTKADEAVKTTTKRTTKSTKSTKSVAEPEVSMN